jgi:hypothetical protein
VLAKLNAAIVKVLAQPDVKKKINEQGAEVYSETPSSSQPSSGRKREVGQGGERIRRQPGLISPPAGPGPGECLGLRKSMLALTG